MNRKVVTTWLHLDCCHTMGIPLRFWCDKRRERVLTKRKSPRRRTKAMREPAWVCTFRLPMHVRDFVVAEGQVRGRGPGGLTNTACVQELILDLRDHFEVPLPGAGRLEAERTAMKLSRREYARYVFSERARLLEERKGSP